MRQIHACSGEGLEFVGFLTHADAANVKEEHAGKTTGGGGGGGGHGVYVCVCGWMRLEDDSKQPYERNRKYSTGRADGRVGSHC